MATFKTSDGARSEAGAVGDTLRRLAGRILLAGVRDSGASFPRSGQLDPATRGGTEIAVHSTRTFLRDAPVD